MKKVDIFKRSTFWDLSDAVNSFISKPERAVVDIQFQVINGRFGNEYYAMVVYEEESQDSGDVKD